MYIRRSLQWAHLRGEVIRPHFYPPKTKAGLRVISIPAELAAALKRWKLKCPPSDLDLVFPTKDGIEAGAEQVIPTHGLWARIPTALPTG
jgi:integrase